MVKVKIVVPGGAGFIGSHISDALIVRGHSVRIYDNLTPHVHPEQYTPEFLNEEAEFIEADIRDR